MSETAIEARGLRRRFGDVTALDGVDITVPQGTVLGLLGPNGAGKTTAVRIFTTVLAPTGGTATVMGLDVVRDAETVRTKIGLAGQYAAVDGNLTGRENLVLIGRLVHLPRPAIGPRADELLERFRLADAADRPVKTYSGGMRRRLDLAAALVHRPPILFLDEPTTGLDPASRLGMWDVVEELVAEGTTVLLTTQYLEEADRLADRIMVIDRGRAIAEGTASELKARLGATVVDLGMGAGQDAGRAREVVSGLGLGDVTALDGTISVTVADGARAVLEAVRALDAAGLAPVKLAVREPTLDDVFLNLTGHRAEEDVPEPVAAETATATANGGQP